LTYSSSLLLISFKSFRVLISCFSACSAPVCNCIHFEQPFCLFIALFSEVWHRWSCWLS
jgi:hypothetical protein